MVPTPNQDGYSHPGFNLRICIFCGAPAKWKLDRKGREYISCGFCQSKTFVYGQMAFTGIQIIHEMLMRSGADRYRRTIQMKMAEQLRRLIRSDRTPRGIKYPHVKL